MNYDIPREPQTGESLTVDWGRRVIRALRSLRPVAGNGIFTSASSDGTTFSTAPSTRQVQSSVWRDSGCWRLVSGTREVTPEVPSEDKNDEPVLKPVTIFDNRYYQIGGKMREHTPSQVEAVEDFVLQGELEEGEEYTDEDKPWVCFRYPADANAVDDETGLAYAPCVIGFKSKEEMLSAQEDMSFVLKPLYLFDHYGAVLCDFRNILDIGAWEE